MKTPVPHDNVPGLGEISYRVGRYGDFRESMLARLSDPAAPFAPLRALRTRAPDDPTIALIDAFAAVAEVLTFYQERLANEGYLRTAVEPRSVNELARLTGYRPRPGVASSVFLSFTVDPAAFLQLPAGTRAQSVPGPGQTAQSFETSDDLWVDGAWNALKPRLSRPTQARADLAQIFVTGVATGLKANDPLLLVVDGAPALRRVASVTVQADRQRTVVALQPPPAAAPAPAPATSASIPAAVPSAPAPPPSPAAAAPTIIDRTLQLAALAQAPPATNPPNSQSLARKADNLLQPSSDAALSLAAGATPAERTAVFDALAQTPLAAPPSVEAHAFRVLTAPGGSRAPPRTIDASGRLLPTRLEWSLATPIFGAPSDLSIEVTLMRDGRASTSAGLTREAGGGIRRTIRFVSRISYGGHTLTLTVDAGGTDTASGQLSAAVGDITCRLLHLDATGLALEYAFAAQPVTVLVTADGNGEPTAVNEMGSAALSNLVATESTEGSPVLTVYGSLAIQTGSKPTEQANVLYLDGAFETITPGTWVAFDAPADSDTPTPPPAPTMIKAGGASTVSRSAYGQTSRVTRLSLAGDWIDPATATFQRAIRETAVYAGSTPLQLADEDVTEDVGAVDPNTPAVTLELDSFTPGLASGRWMMVTGERTDLPGSTSSELVMLAGSQHLGETATASPAESGAFLAGETVHTVLTFAQPLSYSYKLNSVSILGNVAKATQGESVDEILGAGNGAVANQAFTLKKPPLTYVSAATPSGASSTLRVYVNGLEWSEVDSLGGQGPNARVFITQGLASGGVTVRFGDGIHGARLPTGADNVRARYRAGIGASGNVDAGAISTLLSRPLGLKAVSNPQAATGGADADTADATRRAAPVGLVSLSRLVGVRDYEDFALTFAGVGKASARPFAGADGPLVHLTIAGADDGALDPQSDLWLSLAAALDDYGDDEHEVELAARTAKLALIAANVAIDPTRLWSDVEPVIRAALLARFSFARRDLGQPIHVSEVVTAIQTITGVDYVELTLLSAVAPPADEADLRKALSNGGVHDVAAHLARVAGGEGARRLLPAELAYLSDSLPDMLVLNEIKT